ncbi:MAG: DNA internalization-related competence protein ComEC/Rec2 [Pseudomonadota bacterium]
MDRPIPLLALSLAAGVLGVDPALLAMAVVALLIRDRRRRHGPTASLREATATMAVIVAGALLGMSLTGQEARCIEGCGAAAAWMDGRERTFEGIVTEAPLPTRRGWRVSVRLDEPLRTTVHLHLAAPCPPYRLGDRVRGRARFEPWHPPVNPGEFDLRRHRLAQGVAGLGRLRIPPPIVGTERGGVGGIESALGGLRRRIRRGVERSTTDPTAKGLALALTLGERSALPESLRDDFVRAGMAHLLAISGLHLALGALVVSGALRLLLIPFASRLSPRALVTIPYIATIPLVLLQTALAGAPPSCLRAATMLLHLAAARIIDRRPDAATAIGLAALVNLLHHPGAIHEAGFQLSFGATGAILWSLSPRDDGARSLPRLARAALGLARVSLAAFLGTAPFVAWHFGPLPLASPLVNLAAVPVASVALLPGALLVGASCAVAGFAPGVLVVLFEAATRIETWIAAIGADLGLTAPMVPGDVPWLTLACLGALWMLRCGLRRGRPWILVGVGAVGLGFSFAPAPSAPMEMWLLDVGEANLSVVRLACGRVLLMDGGPPGSGRRVLLPFLRSQGIRRVDDLIISHGHVDHFAGALEVYRDLGAPRILTNGSPMIHHELRNAAPPVALHPGLDCPGEGSWDLCGARFLFLSPGSGGQDLDENDRSLVVFLTGRSIRILFTGDMGPRGWSSVAPKLPPGRVSLLQIPHHGHRSPHLSPLLSALNPLVSFAFSDGDIQHGGNMGAQGIISEHSSIYHISGLHGPLHILDTFPTLLLERGPKTEASP